ncbi:MAG: guanylate kinase [Candidatus Bipolaricaulia bacterium]
MATSRTGKLFVLAGPAGTGKTTLRNGLLTRLDQLQFSVSCTTRPPRIDERDGVDYHFISRDRFESLIEEGAFLEWAEVHGRHLYGTLVSDVRQATRQGRDVLLEIDVQGVAQIRERLRGLSLSGHFVFVLPPSWDELRRRLRHRRTEDPDELDRRLQSAQRELAEAPKFDLLVVNRDLSEALRELTRFVRSARVPPLSSNSHGA